jgi:hypothetical protein
MRKIGVGNYIKRAESKMSIIWDSKTDESIIEEAGLEKVRISPDDFGLTKTKLDCENDIKTKVNDKMSKWHIYIHVFDKPDVITPSKKASYAIWMAETTVEPWAAEWWISLPFDIGKQRV